MSKSVQAQAIVMSLRPYFERAEAENLWFFHDSKESGEIWASPEYLRLMQSKGRLLLSPEHWELRDPMGYMKSLHRQAEALIEEYNEMARRFQVPAVLLLEKQDMQPMVERGIDD
ncbi:MAG: hypothetical protein ACI9KN_000982 [Gammaproteobacteria bacterium]|jgi:hypothetical protein